MIAFIEGKVCEKNKDGLIILQQGIGYHLQFDPLYAAKMPSVGETARIYTYFHVREDALSLYAFAAPEEKQLFELLLTVSGIGPKVAGTIVASIDPDEFALAILNSDLKRITSIKGIGKKTGERLIFELKDKLAKSTDKKTLEDLTNFSQTGGSPEAAVRLEAIAALRVLGYSEQEAERAVQKAYSITGADPSLNELIRQALKSMAAL